MGLTDRTRNMKDTVDKLVDMMMDRLDDQQPSLSIWDAKHWLLEQGFSVDDVNEAVCRLVSNLIAGRRGICIRAHSQAPRLYSPFEEAKLSFGAREALTRLEASEMISALERELLIERLLQSDADNEMELLDYLLATVISARRNVETQNTLMNTFDGFGPTYH